MLHTNHNMARRHSDRNRSQVIFKTLHDSEWRLGCFRWHRHTVKTMTECGRLRIQRAHSNPGCATCGILPCKKNHRQIAQDSRRPHHAYHDITWLMQSRSTSAADCIRTMLHLNVVSLKVFIQSNTTIRLKLSSWEQPAQSTSHSSRRWFVHPLSGNNIQPSSTQTKRESSLAEAPACRRSNGLVELPNPSSCEEARTLGVPPECRQASKDARPPPRTKSANVAISWEGTPPPDPAPCRQWDGP